MDAPETEDAVAGIVETAESAVQDALKTMYHRVLQGVQTRRMRPRCTLYPVLASRTQRAGSACAHHLEVARAQLHLPSTLMPARDTQSPRADLHPLLASGVLSAS